MAQTTTLEQIKERALARADFPALASVAFVTSGQLTDWANAELSKLHDIIVGAKEDYHLSIDTIALVSGQEEYALPSNFYKALKVFYTAGGRRYQVGRFMIEELDGFSLNPTGTGDIELWYVPHFEALDNDADVIDPVIAPGWEEYAVLGVALRCLKKDESLEQAGALAAEQQDMENKIRSMVSERDMGEPHRIADVGNRWGTGNDMLFNEGRQFRYRVMGQKLRLFERIESTGS